MTKYEKISIFFSTCALLVSILVYYSSNKQYQDRKEFDEKLRQSQVTIQMGKNREQKNILFKKIDFFKKYSAIYEQEYTLILNNIGFESATITFWKVDKDNALKNLNNFLIKFISTAYRSNIIPLSS